MSKIAERNLTKEECQKIKILREARGVSRIEMAKRINISDTYLFRIEKGQRCSVGYKILRSLANELGVDISVICSNDELNNHSQSQSFESVFLGNEIKISGNVLSESLKIQAYNILKSALDPALTRAKKIERIVSYVYKH